MSDEEPRHDPGPERDGTNRGARILALVIGYTVTAAWAVSFVVGIIKPSYSAPTNIQALMMLVAGSVFALPLIRDRFSDRH